MIDLTNIQGNVLPGFNTAFQQFIAFRRVEAAVSAEVRRWLASLTGEVTSAATVRAQRARMKSEHGRRDMIWLCCAFGHDMLRFLVPDVIFLSTAFRLGFRARAVSVMGDRTDPAGWKVGGRPDSRVDVLLVVAGNDRAVVLSKTDALEHAAAAAGFKRSYRELGVRLTGDKEHFGFKDGVSQPPVDLGDGAGGLPIGQFVFGHEDLDARIAPVVHTGPASFNADGTYLVFRRLRQDVVAFRRFRDAETERLRAAWPELGPAHLEALLVGRWPDGRPVSAQVDRPEGSGTEIDAFDFADDLDGLRCPFGAHIRKVNPRLGGGDLSTPKRRRFLRRGIPFGPTFEEAPEAERGLLFVALQSSIERQVDFVTRDWMNSPNRPNLGNDLLVGRSFGGEGGRMTINRAGDEMIVRTSDNRWVIPTGGAYLFVPSLTSLSELATG